MHKYYVYIHYTREGKPFYIGKGKGSRAYVTKNRNKYWRNTFKKHGLYVQIFRSNLTEKQAFIYEKALIKLFGRDNLTNMTDGGEGTSGRKASSYTKHKMSKSATGRKNSIEHNQNISKARKGTKQSVETIFKRSQALLGHKFSNERNRKLSESLIGKNGKPISQYTKDGIWVKDWPSILEAARALSINPVGIDNNLAGRSKSSGGFIWCYETSPQRSFLEQL